MKRRVVSEIEVMLGTTSSLEIGLLYSLSYFKVDLES